MQAAGQKVGREQTTRGIKLVKGQLLTEGIEEAGTARRVVRGSLQATYREIAGEGLLLVRGRLQATYREIEGEGLLGWSGCRQHIGKQQDKGYQAGQGQSAGSRAARVAAIMVTAHNTPSQVSKKDVFSMEIKAPIPSPFLVLQIAQGSLRTSRSKFK